MIIIMLTMMKFSEKIKTLRTARNLTQKELAERASLSVTFINLLEGDNKSIGAESLDRLAKALNVQMHELLDDVDFQRTSEVNQ